MKCQQPISSQLHFHNGQFTSEEDWILNLATSTIIFWILSPKKYFSLWFCRRFHNLLYQELKTAVKSTMQSTDYLRKTSQIKNSWWDLFFFFPTPCLFNYICFASDDGIHTARSRGYKLKNSNDILCERVQGLFSGFWQSKQCYLEICN